MILVQLVLLIIGLSLVVKGADLLLSSAIALGKKYNISNFFVGIIVVGFGTSLPELLVSIDAIINESPELSIGNVIGSNISNILLVFGLSLCFSKIIIKKISSFDIYFHSSIHILFSLIVWLFIYNNVIGLISIFLFIFYIIISLRKSEISKTEELNNGEDDFFSKMTYKSPFKFGFPIILVSILITFLGAEITVDSAMKISSILGISESFIGLTIIALGTSLPEVATSIRALQRKNSEIIFGNIIGSNIYNLLLILGFVSLFESFNFSKNLLFFEVPFLVFSVILFSVILFFKKSLNKNYSYLFLSLYVFYIFILYISNF